MQGKKKISKHNDHASCLVQKRLKVICDIYKSSVVYEAQLKNILWQCLPKEVYSYLNLAVSGSISSSSRTGERGTLAENFSIWKKIKPIFLKLALFSS